MEIYPRYFYLKILLYSSNFLKHAFIITATLFMYLLFNLAPLIPLDFFVYVFISSFNHPCDSFYENNKSNFIIFQVKILCQEY